jgi:protein involved in polysaccharide export with SLBB domain
MSFKQLLCLVLVVQLILPTALVWGQTQRLEDQAQGYLQNIGPGQGQSTQPPQMPQMPSTQPPIGSMLPQQAPTPSQPVQILTTAPRQTEEVSEVERRAWAHRMFLKQFGYSFFYQAPTSFLPTQAVPVGPDYIIGPGDSIKIIVWGSVQGQYNLTVNRNGQIDIPKIGVVQVSGLSYRQLREAMDREFARQFNNFQMNVTLDNLRTIQVYVVGQARFPGSYAISSLSTLVNALFASGGPGKSGSMRNIQVRRGGKVVVTFDMYDFLLRGDKSKDIRLKPEDVIFIPPIGPVAAIGTPKSMKEVGEALKTMARVQLQKKARETETGLAPAQPSTLTTTDYSSTGAPRSATSWQQQEDLRIITGLRTPQELAFQQQKRADIKLYQVKPAPKSWLEQDFDNDKDEFEKKFGISLPEAVNKLAISKGLDWGGPVKVPGIYELKNDKSLGALLHLAGGLGDIAFKGRVQVLRVQRQQAMILFDEDLGKVESRRQDFRIVDGDFVEIFPVPSLVEKMVAIAGAVKDPGEFGFRDNMRVSDLVAYAGGLLQQADKSEAEITRVSITPQGPETSRIHIRLFAALNNGPRDNVILRPNDYLFIRPVPNWDIYKTVQIAGEVKSPGTYAIKQGEPLSSVLTRAGGFTDRAYPLAAVLLRESTKTLQRQQLTAAIDRLEAQVLASGAINAQTALQPEEAKSAQIAATQQQALVTSLRKVEPLGRVIIHLSDPERLRGTPDDIGMQEGDVLTVPPLQQTVNVVGAVYAPTAVVYAPYKTVKDYLHMAGGPTQIADTSAIYVIRVNGAAMSREGFSWLGRGINGAVVEPGDTIVVPEQLEQISWLKNIKDVTTILSQIALTAGVVLVGLKR